MNGRLVVFVGGINRHVFDADNVKELSYAF